LALPSTVFAPAVRALGLTLVIGAYAVAFGILLIILAFRFRNLPRDV
jgi:uncharacterized membrane protein HdeD (DUF308 family)